MNMRPEIKMPLPNHLHCGVCRANYEDYNQHVESKEHQSSVALNKNFYDLIDKELDDINRKGWMKKWKTSPIKPKPQLLKTDSKL